MIKKIIKYFVDKNIEKNYLDEEKYYNSISLNRDYSIELTKKLIADKKFKRISNDKLNILKVYKNHNWEDVNLLPALQEFGSVIEYDMSNVQSYSLSWHLSGRKKFNHNFMTNIDKLLKENRIDFIFFYVSALVFDKNTLKHLEKLEIPFVNIGLDDRMKFRAYKTLNGYAGNSDICKYFTLNITTCKEACKKYLAEGGIPLYLPPAGNEKVFKKLNLKKDIAVSFIGQNYGTREDTISYLKQNGIEIQAFGQGFAGGFLEIDKMIEIYNRSKITIGFSNILGLNYKILKGRDFEVGLTGSFYLTEYNEELEEYFIEGEDIEFYRDNNELLEKIKFYLQNDEKRQKIADNFYNKCINNHTWQNRFKCVFDLLK